MLPSVKELIDNIEEAQKQTSGPNRYIVGSMKQLIYSNSRLEESTKKTEIIMIWLSVTQVLLVVTQIILSVI